MSFLESQPAFKHDPEPFSHEQSKQFQASQEVSSSEKYHLK